MVLPHIDELPGLLHAEKRRLDHRLRLAHEGHHRTVRCVARVHVEQFHTLHTLNLVGNLFDDSHVAALAEIGHALNNLLKVCHVCLCCMIFFSNVQR